MSGQSTEGWQVLQRMHRVVSSKASYTVPVRHYGLSDAGPIVLIQGIGRYWYCMVSYTDTTTSVTLPIEQL
jgi:hypothetical protein